MSILSILKKQDRRRLTIAVRKVEVGMDLVIHEHAIKTVKTIYLDGHKLVFTHTDGSTTRVFDQALVQIDVPPDWTGLGAEDPLRRTILENTETNE